jgi:large subunit ribosomal protein L13Ae
LKPNRKVTRIGRLSHEVGWQHQAVVAKLEAKRKVRAAAFYKAKKQRASLVTKAKTIVDKKKAGILKEYGY